MAPGGGPDLLTATEICFRYPHNKEIILHSRSLRLESGVVYSLHGDNASGKSTLIRLISGHHPAEAPHLRITIDGKRCAIRPAALRAAGLAACHQNDSLFPSLSIRQNVLLGAPTKAAFRVQRRPVLARVEEFFSKYKTRYDGLADVRPQDALQHLSGGYCVIIRLLRSVVWGFKVILLDEPSAGLSTKTKSLFFDVLRDALVDGKGGGDSRKTGVFVSHIDEEHERLSKMLAATGFRHDHLWMVDGDIVSSDGSGITTTRSSSR